MKELAVGGDEVDRVDGCGEALVGEARAVSGGGAGIRLLSAARRVLAAATSTQAKRPGTGAAAVGCAASKAFRQLYS